MNHPTLINRLEINSRTFEGLLSVALPEETIWRHEEGKWCLLEIACHLYDEERDDFRARLKHALEKPEEKLPFVDPVGWVTARNYIGKQYEPTVQDFLNERTQSVHWLRSLQSPDWKRAHQHPKFGSLSAEMFLANWVAHDYLHIRQILRVKYAYLKQTTPAVSLAYAGKW